MASRSDDDDLAYGEYYEREGDNKDRGVLGDMGRRFFGANKEKESNQQQSSSHQSGSMSFLNKLHDPLHGLVSDLKNTISGKENKPAQGPQEGYQQQGGQAPQQPGQEFHSEHRFLSFAPERHGNNTKWYVDGCSYMYAVSVALERAQESIWILDWWLSPELYLRRPPAKNQQYRVDRMLLAAAERGVTVRIQIYKEITQALTLSSAHTKHALEALHPNIGVFRHPDHLPDAAVLQSSFISSFQNMSLSPAKLAQLPADGLKAIYGAHNGTVMYWAHHEKLCLIDGHTAFMGGLDLCYGRWDTNQHSIADAHPGNIDNIVFPGQDFNNARVLDFSDVPNWENNKLDRSVSSRMGWSDVALCLSGPVVQDLRTHFTQRWNFIYDEKYSKKATRYTRLPDTSSGAQVGGTYPSSSSEQRGVEGREGERGLFGQGGGLGQRIYNKMNQEFQQFDQRPQEQNSQGQSHAEHGAQAGSADCQITRSSAKWSHNITTEHSIQNAYCEIIRDSKHFVYIENQFFITATGDQQKPIKNKIGQAMVERIVRAGRNGEKYKMIIMIPAVPAFAGDLKLDGALGTRAIMEFQYDSINRGGHSIYEEIAKAGFNPMDYIRFYNLRSYDRINASQVMREAEQRSGVQYDQAQQGFDAVHEGNRSEQPSGDYSRYQQEATQMGSRQGLGSSGRWDSVAECYMLNGADIRGVPWEGSASDEMDAFVSEELYIHSKLLIADDQIVICGSANLNDRSQLGDHDSEIAVIIQDPDSIDSTMNGQPWRASKFASSLRREIFRKHLGLLKPQDMERPDANYEPVDVANVYDWGSNEDRQVADPVSDEFQNMWNWRASTNTEAFRKVFHPVPCDSVKNWREYDEFYSRFFGQDPKDKENKKPSLYKWGHVVAENFAQGEQGVREMKEVLSTIKGNLVEMPLMFLKEEDMAKEGVELNALTEELYT